MTLLDCHGLTHAFEGGRHALDGLGVTAEPGEILGVVGPNGAGKTTLLRILAGQLVPDGGEIWIGGVRWPARGGERLVGYAPDPPLIPPEITGLEWLRYLASHCARTPAERLDLIHVGIEIGMLHEFVARRVGEYTQGMVRRLALAAATLSARKLVLLDETMAGIDPLVARGLWSNLSRLAAAGRVIIVASHDLATIEQVATRALILWRGRLVSDISMAALLGERLVELSLNGRALAGSEWLVHRFRGAARTGGGVAIPLLGGLSVEQVLEECRVQRIAVAASRIRYRRLEDILVAANAGKSAVR